MAKKILYQDNARRALERGMEIMVEAVSVTLGPKGLYFANSSKSYFVNAFNLKDDVVDTTGAGDAFNGAFAYALSKNQNNKDAIEFANKVAGISTTRAGAANAMPKLDEVEVY